MTGRPTDLARGRRGGAILEGALVTLILVNVLIGTFDLGQVLFIRQTFVSRARSAARYGTIANASETAVKNMVLYGSPDAPEGAPSGPFGLTAAMISVAKSDLGSSAQRLVVTVSGYPYRFFTPWIAGTFAGRDVVTSAPMETP
jgi:Flp pilus assembly protein TadG